MRIKTTINKIRSLKTAKVTSYSTPIVVYVEGNNLEFRALGTLLQIYDKTNKVEYNSTSTYASAITALDAAQTLGLQWVI